ncbi:MAG: helix-turn-helix domain-containing protein [Chloroflexi bacterium]|nr:helix-turn-helix domain-containing protein [Chloroflexota bacterium]MDA8189301.1 helix-turn-helix domain-containing protein [Dehalococcoidales bacterium]
MAKVKNRLREVRMKAVLSQGELAKRVGVHQTVLSQIEKRQTSPGVGLALELARALHVYVEDIFLLDLEPKTGPDKQSA